MRATRNCPTKSTRVSASLKPRSSDLRPNVWPTTPLISRATDILIRDLTAHRTLGLRLALSEQPEVAIVAVTHALSAQIFYRGADAHVLDIRPVSTVLASHADGIEDTKAGKAWADHHASWAAQMPRDVSHLWAFVVELDHDSRMALFAHCVA